MVGRGSALLLQFQELSRIGQREFALIEMICASYLDLNSSFMADEGLLWQLSNLIRRKGARLAGPADPRASWTFSESSVFPCVTFTGENSVDVCFA